MGKRKGTINKVEELPRGVSKFNDGRAKPFRVTHRKQKPEFFATAEQAVSRKNEMIALEKAQGAEALNYNRPTQAEVVEAREILPAGVSIVEANHHRCFRSIH